jgi:hypothetical protein
MNTRKFCTSCGEPHDKDAMFCEKCGAKLGEDGTVSGVKAVKKGLSSKLIIAVIVLAVVAVGSVAGYSMLAKSFSPEKIIRNTLALESGRIKVDYIMETGWSEENQENRIDFIKNKKEKTILVRDDYDDETYASIQNGKVLIATGWYEDEFDLKDETGIDAAKLEKDLVNYLAGTFKGKKVPKDYLENVEKSREDGKYVISFDVANEARLIGWIYECFDLKDLRDIILKNLGNSDAKEEFKEGWDYALDEMDYGMDELYDGIDLLGRGLKTSVKIAVDKKGILDEIEVKVSAEEAMFGQDVNAIVKISISDKNQIDTIRRP